MGKSIVRQETGYTRTAGQGVVLNEYLSFSGGYVYIALRLEIMIAPNKKDRTRCPVFFMTENTAEADFGN